MQKRKKRPRLKPEKNGAVYRSLWRIVDGAMLDALKQHPDYIPPHRVRAARNSICKRVVGAVLGFAAEAAKGRSDANSAADKA